MAAHNKLAELPLSVVNLRSLAVLRAENNELKGLPVGIGRLSNVEELVCACV
jgi:Leucine-rich repeat (LRR) protein